MFDDPEPTRAEVLAVGIAERVASWPFALCVIGLVSAWVVVNIIWQPFEPYPVVVLAVISAVLASLAALQGPLILLTQRRSAERDRLRDREVLMVAANTEADLHRVEAKLDRLLATGSEAEDQEPPG